MPTSRSAMAWGTYKGLIYVAGGAVRNATVSVTYCTVEAYNPASNRWLSLPLMEIARHGLAGDVIGNKLCLVSGDVQSGGAPGAVIETDVHEVLTLD